MRTTYYKFSNLHYCTFKGDKGKVLDVQSQIFNFISFFPRKLASVNSFQKPNFCISLFNYFNSFFTIVNFDMRGEF